MFQKLQVVEKGKDFERCTKINSYPIPDHVEEGYVLVRNHYAGVNATDLTSTQNVYGPQYTVPYDFGLEAVGEVVLLGEGVQHLTVGDPVAVYWPGGYAEYQVAPATVCQRIPRLDPIYLTVNVSGLTAAVALGEVAQPKPSDTALVTAAAGGTGSIAVQLLKKKYKCKCVVGTCSTPEKADYLVSIGCDKVINYKVSEEELAAEMDRAAPHGFDVVYECVGGTLQRLAVQHLAVRGRIVFIGGISGYADGTAWQCSTDTVDERSTEYAMLHKNFLLLRSASAMGFMLPTYREVIPTYFADLVRMLDAGELHVRLDPNGQKEGLQHVKEAVDYLSSGKSYGKNTVRLV
ncbi:putative oxidoreductase [Leptomonas pyrrhocoris]|uniref:Putative oxidoreductase n=1 Tax=Leptomonas pyrrhocoris TaxID=157538 RepID=A0A0M9G2Q2_LEPPY|nr:putative oxidoreductase [Leptomonas pyrrhocoris]KPA81155.1 putative oxidoreductase [Leptomonas pyrrhocoris]|eukprot:XP_015659594.1 putative oxidoreductase [Leptomonas pyrrhocoris]